MSCFLNIKQIDEERYTSFFSYEISSSGELSVMPEGNRECSLMFFIRYLSGEYPCRFNKGKQLEIC